MAESKRDYYEVLGVGRDADAATLKKAYRQIAKKYHPDMNPGDAEAEKKFKEASEAYAVLSDPDKRRQYDQFGHAAFEGGAGGAGGFGGFDFSGADFSDIFGDIFGDLFGGGGRRGRANVKKNWMWFSKIPARNVTGQGQSRELPRRPVRNAEARARWSIRSSPSSERCRMYRPVRTATEPVRSSGKNVRIAEAPDIFPAAKRSP